MTARWGEPTLEVGASVEEYGGSVKNLLLMNERGSNFDLFSRAILDNLALVDQVGLRDDAN